MFQLFFLLAVPISVFACPGSSSYMHAKCEMNVKFSNGCDVVMSEILGRVNSNWVDPHNGGTYSITASNSSFIAGQRLTGDKKYTDKFDFYFTPSGGNCLVDACSESQVNSLIDYSTNYCNLHDLYCSSADGCPTAGKDLTYTESYTSCSQHDNVCVVKGNVRVKSRNDEKCTADISDAAGSLTKAGLEISKSVVDCASGFTPACEKDINNILEDLTAATVSITNAVYDCSDGTPTQCSADIDAIVGDVTAATSAIMDAVIACPAGQTVKCSTDIAKAAGDLTSAGLSIAKAVQDC